MNTETEICYICLDNLDFTFGNLKCGCFNRYHTICLEKWLLLENNCPICKKKINETQMQNKNINRDDEDNMDNIFYTINKYELYQLVVYFILLLSVNHIIYICFLKQ